MGVELRGFFCYCFAFLLSSRICSCFSKSKIMPFDTKRINGPEVSFDYKKFIKDRKAKNIFKNWNDYKGQRLSLHRTRPNQSHLCSLWSTRDSKTFRFFDERNPKLHI